MNRTAQFWDRQAARYAGATPDPELEMILSWTQPYLRPGDHILDFACGTGESTRAIAGSVQSVLAMDLSRGMLDVCQSLIAAAEITNVRFHQGTLADDAILADASFDVILAFNSLHLLPDLPAALERAYALLRPGGLFITATPCLGERRSLVRSLLWLVSRVGLVPPVTALTQATVDAQLSRARFAVTATQILSGATVAALTYFIVARRPTLDDNRSHLGCDAPQGECSSQHN